MSLPLFLYPKGLTVAEYYDDDYSYEVENPRGELVSVLFGNDFETDAHAQDLFKEAFFNNDEGAYQDLVDWLWDEHGIDFEGVFEWEDFREWYDANAA
jgi:hypothetical protein